MILAAFSWKLLLLNSKLFYFLIVTLFAYFSSNPSFTIPLSNFSFVLIIIVRLFPWRALTPFKQVRASSLCSLNSLPLLRIAMFLWFSSRLHFGHHSFVSFWSFNFQSSTFNPTILFPLQTLWLTRQTFKSVDEFEFFFFFVSQNFNRDRKKFFPPPKKKLCE